MKKICATSMILLIFICLVACGNELQASCTACGKSISATASFCEHCGANLLENDSTDSSTNGETETTGTSKTEDQDSNYNDYLALIEAGQYKEAYEKINSIKDKQLVEDLRSKFVVIEDVLLSKTLKIPDDKFGNKIGPFNIDYIYDDNGNIVEIDATNIPIYNVPPTVVNHFMRWTFMMNYTPYHEELTYDSNNRLTKIVGYLQDTEKIIHTVDFFYDEQGNNYRIEQSYNSGTAITLREYNKNNQLIKVQGIDGDRTYYTATVQYDEHGNILEEGTIRNDKGQIVETKFTYRGTEQVESICEWNYGDFYIYKG